MTIETNSFSSFSTKEFSVEVVCKNIIVKCRSNCSKNNYFSSKVGKQVGIHSNPRFEFLFTSSFLRFQVLCFQTFASKLFSVRNANFVKNSSPPPSSYLKGLWGSKSGQHQYQRRRWRYGSVAFSSSVTSKKSPNVYKTCPKMISLANEKF